MRKAPRVLTVGEASVVVDPLGDGGLTLETRFRLRVSGAEANVAIALSRLGVGSTWISRLGTDPMGDLIIRTLDDEGVDVRDVTRDPAHPTAATFRVRDGGMTRLFYYRRGSAASLMQPGDVLDSALRGVSLLHVTGITMAIGEGPRALVRSLVERAARRGIIVTFDLNHRLQLWTTKDAANAVRTVLPAATWVLCGEDEGRLLFGGHDAQHTIARLREAGAGNVVLRVGANGALVATTDTTVAVPAEPVERLTDEVGAGDAFDAGFIFGLTREWRPEQCARLGNLMAARAMSGTGHWETLPTLAEIAYVVADIEGSDVLDERPQEGG